MNAFSDAEKDGTGLLHNDFNQLKKGDLVFRLKSNKEAEHVMIATGKVDQDKDGNITAYEVIHAPSAGKAVEYKMISVDSDKFRIGHTKRNGNLDLIMNTYVTKNKESRKAWNAFYNWISINNLWDKLN
jgi:hypothetical protein